MINVFKYLEGCRVEKGGEFVLSSFRRQHQEQGWAPFYRGPPPTFLCLSRRASSTGAEPGEAANFTVPIHEGSLVPNLTFQLVL